MSDGWSLEELIQESLPFLEEGESGRVQWVPNARQIRYYATLGLMDKPDTDNGKTVWYGPRHLLQLLSIKRLQQNGMKLSQVQRVLAGKTLGELRELVGISDNHPDWPDELEPRKAPRDDAFWMHRPSIGRPSTFARSWHLEIEPGVTVSLSDHQADQLSQEERDELAVALTEAWRAQREKRRKPTP